MKTLQILGFLLVLCACGCGPQVSGPGTDPVDDPADAVIDEALEAEANAASEEEAP